MNFPPYPTYPQLQDERIILRQILPEEGRELVDVSYYDGVQATNAEEALAILKKIEQDYRKGESIHWGIAERTSNTLLGTCGYYRGFDRQAGELGCILLPSARGKGHMHAALALAIHFGIQHLKLQRIWASTSRENERAIRLLHKLHFNQVQDTDEGGLIFDYPTH